MQTRSWVGPVSIAIALGVLAVALVLLPTPSPGTHLLVPTWLPRGTAQRYSAVYDRNYSKRPHFGETEPLLQYDGPPVRPKKAQAVWGRLAPDGTASAAIRVLIERGSIDYLPPWASWTTINGRRAYISGPLDANVGAGLVVEDPPYWWLIASRNVSERELVRFTSALHPSPDYPIGTIDAAYLLPGFKKLTSPTYGIQSETRPLANVEVRIGPPDPNRSGPWGYVRVTVNPKDSAPYEFWDKAWSIKRGGWVKVRGHRALWMKPSEVGSEDAIEVVWKESPTVVADFTFYGFRLKDALHIARSLREVSRAEWDHITHKPFLTIPETCEAFPDDYTCSLAPKSQKARARIIQQYYRDVDCKTFGSTHQPGSDVYDQPCP